MRIVHLSDIHLSEDNYTEFDNNYRDALINDLNNYYSSIPIDLIVITGDLVDKGGYSLFKIKGFENYENPYDIFKKIFIEPISEQLGIPLHQFLFIPGNHDIDEKGILLYDENALSKNINSQNIKKYLSENHGFIHNQRIKKFKDFEKEYHKDNSNYEYTTNQSTYFYEKTGLKIGFILVNDSWRCKSIKLKNDSEKLFFGEQQLYDGLNHLESINTDLNICLLHHSVDDYAESSSVKGILQRKKIELFLYGHFHNTQTNNLYTPQGYCLGFRSRAALFKPEEKDSEYHSGYQILDFDLIAYKITQVHYRKYDHKDSAKIFIADNETAPHNGIDKNKPNKDNGFDLYREERKTQTRNLDKNLFKS
jgi:predicted MPP superfamily phosphohydrolase